MVEGSGDVLVPSVMVKCDVFDLSLYLFYCGHDHSLEMFRFENYNLVVVVFALFMVCSSAKQVSFLVCHTWFVVKREVVFS